MDLATVEAALAAEALTILGGFHPDPADRTPPGTGTLLLAGPRQPAFWPQFAATPEARDGAPDPLDRWTARTLPPLAARLGAAALFPFGGPPHLPFLTWATRTGELHVSPVGLLVHARFGLSASFRAALAFQQRLALPSPAPRPCDTCDAPCAAACPPGALTPSGYDVPACRAHVERPAGEPCRAGCLVRRACPIGRDLLPPEAQRAFHMRAFRGRQEG